MIIIIITVVVVVVIIIISLFTSIIDNRLNELPILLQVLLDNRCFTFSP